MLGHLSFGVKDLAAAAAFYDALLAPLGVVRVWDTPKGVGYGAPGGQDRLALFPVAEPVAPGPGFHLAFDAPSPAAVDAFHAAALALGGEDRGPPGPAPPLQPHLLRRLRHRPRRLQARSGLPVGPPIPPPLGAVASASSG